MNPFDPVWIAEFTKRAQAQGLSQDIITAYIQQQQMAYLDPNKGVRDAVADTPVEPADVGRSIVQGATFGFGDELTGAAKAMIPGGQGYTEGRDQFRAEDARFRQEHPLASTAAELGGGLASAGLPIGAAAKEGLTIAQRARRGAAFGAGMGALNAAGHADGSPRERLRAAGYGAGFGGALGAAMPYGIAGARAVKDQVVMRGGQALGFNRAENIGMQRIVQNMIREGRTPDQIRRALAEMRTTQPDVPVALADVTGPSGVAVTRGAASRPGASRELAEETLEGRDLGRSMRLEGGLTDITGRGRTDMVRAVEDLDAAFRPKAQELYDRAYSALDGRAFGAIDDPVINALLDTPAIGEIWEDALQAYNVQKSLARAAGKQMPDLVPIVEKGADGAWHLTGQHPDTRTLDYLKRGMDAFIDRRMTGPAMNKGVGIAMKDVRNTLLDRLDEINPAYKDARAFYRGGLDANRAIELGSKALSKSPEEIAGQLRGLDQFGQRLYRLAGQQAIRERMRTQGGITQLLNPKNRALRERVQALFDTPEEYQSFVNLLRNEATLAKTERAINSGSRTAFVEAEQAATAPSNVDMFLRLGRDGFRGVAYTKLGELFNRVKFTQEVADAIVRKMLTLTPREQETILNQLDVMRRAAITKAMASAARDFGAASAVGIAAGRAAGLMSQNRGAE
jgi:hypothetical protein